MFRTILFLFAFGMQMWVYAQFILVTRTGETINYKKLKMAGEEFRLTIPGSKEKVAIKMEDVDAYFSESSNTVYYFRPDIFSFDGSGVEFIERVEEGRIKAYKKVIYNPVHHQDRVRTTTMNFLYLEKEGHYVNVLATNTIGEGKKKKQERLIELVSDDPESLSQVNHKSYKHKLRNIIDVVRTYNLNTYDSTTSTNGMTGRIVFFRRKDLQHKGPASLVVHKEEYLLVPNDKTTVDAPVDTEVVVCLSNGDQKECRLVRGSPYFDIYYEVSSTRSGALSITKKEKEYADFHLGVIDYHVNKRSED